LSAWCEVRACPCKLQCAHSLGEAHRKTPARMRHACTVLLCVAWPRSACARGVSFERVQGCNQRRTWCMGKGPDGSIHARRHARLKLHASMCIVPSCTLACALDHAFAHARLHQWSARGSQNMARSRRRVVMSDVIKRVRKDAHARRATPIGATH